MRAPALVALSALLLASPARAEEAAAASARIEVAGAAVALAVPFAAAIAVRVPPGSTVPGAPVGPVLGDVSVIDGAWDDPVVTGEGVERVWRGRLAAFRLGEVSIPAVPVVVLAPDGSSAAVETEAVTVSVTGAIDPASGTAPPEIADLKPPAVVPPDYRRLGWALLALVALAAVALAAWWAGRRFAGRFAKVEVETDPFRRLAPDAWAFAELERLLGRRFAEDGREDLFHEELSRIVRRYLSGRYRVDLMERTTGEVGPALRQAGMDDEAAATVLGLLERTDLAKFARVESGSEGCRAAVEAAYAIVDRTRARTGEEAA